MVPEPEKSSLRRVLLGCLMITVVAAFSVWLWNNMLQPLAVIGGLVCLTGAILVYRGATQC